MEKHNCCAVLGHSPMRFAWGFDEEDTKCKEMKLELLQQFMALPQQGVTQFMVGCDPGVGLYAAERNRRLILVHPNDLRATVYPHK